jgi:hypothetical protein
MHVPDMAPSIPCCGAKRSYLAPNLGWFQAEERTPDAYRFPRIGRMGAVISILPKAQIANIATALVPAVGIEPTTNGLQNRCSTN